MKRKRTYKKHRQWRSVSLNELDKEFASFREQLREEFTQARKIPPELLKGTEGLPWHARRARISAITGKPFSEVSDLLGRSYREDKGDLEHTPGFC